MAAAVTRTPLAALIARAIDLGDWPRLAADFMSGNSRSINASAGGGDSAASAAAAALMSSSVRVVLRMMVSPVLRL